MDSRDILIIAAIGVAAYLLFGSSSSPATVPTSPIASLPTSAQYIQPPFGVSTAPTVSGGYQTASLTAAFGASPGPGWRIGDAGQWVPPPSYGGTLSAQGLPTVFSPLPVSAPPPPFFGGLVGGVGSGGNPLGGPLRAGISGGTRTTLTPTPSLTAVIRGAAPPVRPGSKSASNLVGIPLVIA